MENKIFLERMRSKESSNTSGGLNVKLKGNRKLLPLNDVSNVISLMEQYTEEREKCNTIRLTCQVNPICSNVLFNRISEIVKYEGSKDVTFLNYGISGETNPLGDNQVKYKPDTLSFWSSGSMGYQSVDERVSSLSYSTHLDTISDRTTIKNNRTTRDSGMHPTNAIRDTQLSRTDDKGEHFVYHCGLDILNNHLIRSKTFKTVCKMPENFDATYTAFNTIADLMRDTNGEKVIEKLYFPSTSGVDGGAKLTSLHLYLYDDIMTFNDAVANRLVEKHNGWLGFINRSKIKSYTNFKGNEDMKMERPLMYMNGGDFVDMYPGRDLYSFVPKYNKYRNRMEKNWNYCVTYPSSSTTNGFDEIIETSNNSMKTVYFDENTRTDGGATQLVIYSRAKHGLVPGDTVNIYKNYMQGGEMINELVLANAKVDAVASEFIFTTFTQGVQISDNWVMLNDNDLMSGFTANGIKYDIYDYGRRYFYTEDNFDLDAKYYIIEGKNYVNIDTKAQNITYKKVVNGIECDYYVRIFSRFPNFKFASGDTSSEYSIYNKSIADEKSLLEIYQSPEFDFESHVSRLAFARNAYSDEIGEIVFTDDINISNIHDNLGRPISELYLTIVKNNAGYKEWYGFDGTNVNISADTVEFSHCFGKITCGLQMSVESVVNDDLNNIATINNIKGFNSGFDVGSINNRGADAEIIFKDDINFYGDLCYYDNYNAVEHSIQPIMHRFNTAQRESTVADMGRYFASYTYDEITKDDYDVGDAFMIDQTKVEYCNSKPEGYYYIPHYRIPIKTFGKLNSIMPQFLNMQSIVNDKYGDDTTQITTQQYHFLKPGDKAIIYDSDIEKYYYLTTVPGKGDNDRTFTCKIFDEKGDVSHAVDGDKLGDYKLFKIDNLDIPSYAHLLKDGTCRYIWRNIINNGSMGGDEIEEYPFTNGAFYINKRIDLYLRRQDPYDTYDLYDEDDINKFGIEVPLESINDYKNEDEITC